MRCCRSWSTGKNGKHGICRRRRSLSNRQEAIDRWRALVRLMPTVMARRPNPDSEENIRRIDTRARAKKQTHGFQVHFLRGTSVLTRMFSDTLYGGREGARRAARKFKRTALRRLAKRKVGGLKPVNRRRRNPSRRVRRRRR